ncbi:hypothetical protein K435DRAFT_650068, partial [Dendrothele bispora CBS 962.96]
MLYPKGYGYPLWTPEPNEQTPLVYRKVGIQVGDVGFITQDGGFEFLFNITLPKDHKIHQKWRGIPEDFEQLKLNEKGYSTGKNQIPKGETIHSKETEVQEIGGYFNVRASDLPTVTDTNIGFQLHSTHSEGAALLLPQGASRTDYMMDNSLRDFAIKNAQTWYRYIHEQGYSYAWNGSLYIITGFFKTACYHTAV